MIETETKVVSVFEAALLNDTHTRLEAALYGYGRFRILILYY